MTDPKTPEAAETAKAPKTDVGSMMEGMRSQLEADQADGKLAGLTVDRLAKAVSHPKAQAVISELMALEPTVVEQGEPAPDFSLPFLQGGVLQGGAEGEKLTLSDHFGKRPVALIFGSYT